MRHDSHKGLSTRVTLDVRAFNTIIDDILFIKDEVIRIKDIKDESPVKYYVVSFYTPKVGGSRIRTGDRKGMVLRLISENGESVELNKTDVIKLSIVERLKKEQRENQQQIN